MNRCVQILLAVTMALASPPAAYSIEDSNVAFDGKLFVQQGSDPTFKELQAKGEATRERNPKIGVTGSKILVNKELVETLPESKRPMIQEIRLHTLMNSVIPRKDFPKWTRWYQEDGHTQIFRLFKDEVNLHNDRELAARTETFSNVSWTEADGKWHEWSGVVTAIKPVGMNLQVKNNENDWSVAISVSKTGNVHLNRRRGEDEIIAKDMLGKPFHLRVRDNGLNYEVFYNGKNVGDGSFKRPEGKTCFRWGMYVGANEVKEDAMIFFSGVTVDGKEVKQ